MNIQFYINGEKKNMDVDPCKRLIDFLREDLNLKGVKEGCSEGECGACTIIMDSKAVTSCTILTGQINNTSIITIEGLKKMESLILFKKPL